MNAELIAAWAGVAGTLVAAVGLFATAFQIRTHNRTQDADWLFRYHAEIRDMERRLRKPEEGEQDANFVEMMNLLSLCAKACNENLFPKRTRGFATDYLVKAIATIQSIEGLHPKIEAITTLTTTFKELADFSTQHRKDIEMAARETEVLKATQPP